VTTTSVPESFSTDIEEIFTDPTELIVKALVLNLEVRLEGLSGQFEFDISFSANGTYSFPLFRLETPIGVQAVSHL